MAFHKDYLRLFINVIMSYGSFGIDCNAVNSTLSGCNEGVVLLHSAL